LMAKLLAGTLVAVAQAYALLVIARLYGVRFPATGFITVLPALILVGLALGAVGLLLSSLIQQLENFAGVMNFVIFPLFFLSSALYPLWRMKEASLQLYWLCAVNPFTHGIELIRFALYGKINGLALTVIIATLVVFAFAAIISYDPRTALVKRQVS
jgi:ABC-2 type transport system permease protein